MSRKKSRNRAWRPLEYAACLQDIWIREKRKTVKKRLKKRFKRVLKGRSVITNKKAKKKIALQNKKKYFLRSGD
jgi:hypothetical protein